MSAVIGREAVPTAGVLRGAHVTHDRAWASTFVADLDGVTARVHWTDAAYPWHVNDGTELFVVLDGEVDMHWRDAAGERTARLGPGDLWSGGDGVVHRAVPIGEARVLVVERPEAERLVDSA